LVVVERVVFIVELDQLVKIQYLMGLLVMAVAAAHRHIQVPDKMELLEDQVAALELMEQAVLRLLLVKEIKVAQVLLLLMLMEAVAAAVLVPLVVMVQVL
jgi:hypothetical protein